MRWTKSALVLLLGVVAFAEPPVVRVKRIQGAPKIDGELNDAFRKEATRLEEFHLLASGKAPQAPTEAWLGTDGQFLYVAFRCHDTDLTKLVHRVTRRDGGVSRDDSIEVFIEPGTGGRRYLHFFVSVGNVQAEQKVENGKRDRDWNAQWKSATAYDPLAPEEGWRVEVAIPLYEIKRFAGSGQWRMNLCRNKRTPPEEFSSSAPVRGGFHEPESFGTVLGLKSATPGGPTSHLSSSRQSYRLIKSGGVPTSTRSRAM